MKKTTVKKPARTAQAARTIAKNKKPARKLTTSALRIFNFAAAALLVGQAAALILLSDKQKGNVSLTADYLTRDPAASEAAGQTVLSQAADNLVNINLVYLAAAVLVLVAVVNLLMATRWRAAYETELKAGTNKFRWLGYVPSLSLLLVTGAMVTGLRDVAGLLMLIALTAIGCTAAMNFERQRLNGGSAWLMRLASLAGLIPALVIGLYVFFSHVYGGGLPFETLIITAVLGLGLLVSVLGLNNIYRTNSKPAQYLAVERAYLIFGFLIPSLFAWTLYSLMLK